MRKTIYLLLAMTATSAVAARLTPAEALSRAIAGHAGSRAAAAATSDHRLVWTATNENVYAFNRTGGGFVVAAGDDSMGASLLGYSDTGSIDPHNMPPALVSMLEAFSTGHFETGHAASPKAAVAPILKTEWAQDEPFFNQCPTLEGERSVTGCAATSIAQVLNHLRYPDCGTGIATATLGTAKTPLTLDLDECPIDWDNVISDYRNGYSTAQADAVANLMLVTGMAINMNYTPYSSGATVGDCVTGLTSHLKFDKSMRSLRRDFFTVGEWNDMVHAQLEADRPVPYFGFSAMGGHAFVIDGYDGSGGEYFHVNWGWAGMSDGYFLLTNLSPQDQGIGGVAESYNKNQEALFDMQPDFGTPDYRPVIGLYGSFGVKSASILKTKDPEFCTSAPGMNNYEGFYNVGIEIAKGRLGIKATDTESGEETYIASDRESNIAVYGRERSFVIKSEDMPGEGTYTLTPAFLCNGVWHEVAQDASVRVILTLTVTDKRFKFSSESVSAQLELKDVSYPDGDFINDSPVHISATLISHNGDFAGSIIPVLCSGNTIMSHMSPANVSLAADESIGLEWNEPFDMKLPEGNYNLYIVREEGFKGLFGPVSVKVSDHSGVNETLRDDRACDTEIYDLSGMRVTRPAGGGIYIVRTGDKVTRVRY